MPGRSMIVVDGNEAAASVAHRVSEVIAIYPITPSSTMGELADEWSAHGRANIWGAVPQVTEMQSEGGAAGAVHGALQAGALATTFTASQGLLLMIPNMYKIAGELTPFCMHVSARALATHALSIFGDHSDVMACRQTGFAMLASGSVQEAHDLACIAHSATLRARVPFLHFFDGFRTSHEVAKIERLGDVDLHHMIDDTLVAAHRARALTPDRPVLRGTAQNPDVFFQAREAGNSYHLAAPSIVKETMGRFAALTGRRYDLFDYAGHPEAERVLVMMGSGAETAHETVEWMAARGERVGVLKVRVYRPFSIEDFCRVLPSTVTSIAVMDRTKEPGAVGDPLYLDVVAALREAGRDLRVIGGRYGLGSKEFTPAMVRAVLQELGAESPRRHFTVGIVDDVTHTSLAVEPEFDIEREDVVRAIFFGLGSDGTVSANKNSIKIIGEETGQWVQGYFVYDSRKAGSVTTSHLRFGPRPIRSEYLIGRASFIACHQPVFLDRYEVLERAAPGAIFLLNAPCGPDEAWARLPRETQETILARKIRFFVIDASRVAAAAGMGGRINSIMQTCFFAISGVLPRDQAIEAIKSAIRKSYEKKGEEVVLRNFAAVDQTLENLHEVPIPAGVTASKGLPAAVPQTAPDFVQRVTAVMLANKGDLLPVSAFPVDGTWPLGTTRWEKRAIALQIPVWDDAICIQCNKCALVCPHAAIRAKVYSADELDAPSGVPGSFKSCEYKGRELPSHLYTIQVAPEDCTGCGLCVMVCPAKDRSNPRHKAIDMVPMAPLREQERINYDFFLDLPEPDRTAIKLDVKGSQFLEPLFEYSGACSGCGETPYIKLLTQLFGDRALIANATGCSSIYGGNLPTTPYTTNRDGRGPAWSNSLFEDNAEFGLGYRLAIDQQGGQARRLLVSLAAQVGATLVDALLGADQSDETGIAAQRGRVEQLRLELAKLDSKEARLLGLLADYLVKKSVWIVGGDGWAYDIGYGGLDHVMALGPDVNVLVLDTEVYSNTGGQQSKATPMGAAAKFAVAGKSTPKKDLGLLAMTYGNVYVARIAFGAKDAQTVKAFVEAESYPGPSLIIAYSPCIAHGYDLAYGAEQQKLAVDSGHWPLFRFDPRRAAAGETPLVLDSPMPRTDLGKYMRNESRYLMVERQDREVPEAAGVGATVGCQPVRHLRAARETGRAGGARSCRRRHKGAMMDLRTTYLGLELEHPIIPGASPLVDDLDTVRALEDAGAPCIVMHSLFEEQITREDLSIARGFEPVEGIHAESISFLPSPGEFALGPHEYLEQVRRIRQAVSVPVIGSLNGVTADKWLEYAKLIEQAGAAALELNVYHLATDPSESSALVEKRTLDIVRRVKKAVSIPIAVKLSPFFSSLAHFARELDERGTDGLVIFNRFYQPDIDTETLEVVPSLRLSDSSDLLLRLRWIAILYGQVKSSLALTGGVHTSHDAVKAVMAGADAVQTVSALLRHGPGRLRVLRDAMADWMEEHGYDSLRQMKGSMSLQRCPDPASFERSNYMRVLQSWRG